MASKRHVVERGPGAGRLLLGLYMCAHLRGHWAIRDAAQYNKRKMVCEIRALRVCALSYWLCSFVARSNSEKNYSVLKLAGRPFNLLSRLML